MKVIELKNACLDLLLGMKSWRVWAAMAIFDIKSRYRRSGLGQFWITISMAVTIIALGLVYSIIFKIPLQKYIPLVGISYMVWGLIASLVQEGATCFVEAEHYVKSSGLPKSIYVYRVVFRNLLAFGHNLILLPIIFIIFDWSISWSILYAIPAIVLLVLNSISLMLVLGPICARFRDVPQIINSTVQIAFFVSPVIWERFQLPEGYRIYLDINPFAWYLELVRNPLLGYSNSETDWLRVIVFTIVGNLIAIVFFASKRSRIAFYL